MGLTLCVAQLLKDELKNMHGITLSTFVPKV